MHISLRTTVATFFNVESYVILDFNVEIHQGEVVAVVRSLNGAIFLFLSSKTLGIVFNKSITFYLTDIHYYYLKRINQLSLR